MGTDDRLRASDKDRDQVADILRDQYAQGRLTIEEFEERSAAALAARTMGDLAPLTEDLPVATTPVVAPSSRPPLWMLAVGALAVLFVIGLVLGIAEFAGPAVIVMFILIARGRSRRRFYGGSGGRRYGGGHYYGGGRQFPLDGPGGPPYGGGGPPFNGPGGRP